MTLGFIGFPVFSFWIALYFQDVQGYSSLMTGVHMLPMVVFGLLANLVAALIQHKVSNKLLMAIGAFAYLISFVLAAVQRNGDSYWAFTFPALCLCVIGADFQFIVANVTTPLLATCTRPLTCYRCTSSPRCPSTGNPSRARSSKPSPASAPQSASALQPLSFKRYKKVLHARATMRLMRRSRMLRRSGSRLLAPPSG